MRLLYASSVANASKARLASFLVPEIPILDLIENAASGIRAQAVLSTEDDESAGGYFVTGTMKDFVPTW